MDNRWVAGAVCRAYTNEAQNLSIDVLHQLQGAGKNPGDDLTCLVLVINPTTESLE